MTAVHRKMDLLSAHIGLTDRRNLLRVDWVIVLLVVALAAIGLMNLDSASGSKALSYHWIQAQFVVLGFLVAAAIVWVDYRFLVSMAPVMLLGVTALLIAVPIIGTAAKGGQHWLVLWGFRIQPSELSKVALVYSLAWYLSLVKERIRRLPYFVLGFAIAGFVCGLIILQRDIGTTMTLMPIAFVMLYVAGCKKWHLLVVVLAGLAALPAAWSQLTEEQRGRVTFFLHPEEDPGGKGFHQIQTKITVGSGGISGKGFGKGTQTHLSYLPEYHTDFVFALLAEEHGLAGALLVVGLYGAFLLRGLYLARQCQEMAGTLLAVGCVTILGFHVFVNIAITLGLLPITGLPLPFLSYGGSFYLATMMCVGTILTVNVRRGMFD
jgi:rod shape determining protein RodA